MISPLLFVSLLYVGFHKPKISDVWILEDKFLIQPSLSLPDNLDKNISFVESELGKAYGLGNRFELISRLYQKALLENEYLEEKFLWLWTILEIFPMQNVSDIKPLCSYLSEITKRDTKDVKIYLKIGLFYGVRSKLVHDGYMNVETVCKDIGEFMHRIGDIVTVIISSLCGLQYSGILDKYFDSDYNFEKACPTVKLNPFDINIVCEETYMERPSIPAL